MGFSRKSTWLNKNSSKNLMTPFNDLGLPMADTERNGGQAELTLTFVDFRTLRTVALKNYWKIYIK